MTVYKCQDYVLDVNNSSKAFVYYKDQLLLWAIVEPR